MSDVSAALAAARLSALRLVSFVPPDRQGVHVGLLTPDAHRVIDLSPLGIHDALDAVAQLPMLRQTAGALVHGDTVAAFAVEGVHLIGAMPLARSVVQSAPTADVEFADPTTVHGPGGHLSRSEAAASRAGLAVLVGEELAARSYPDDETLDRALVGSLVVLGWPQSDAAGETVLRIGAVGPYCAVPRRRPESLTHARVAPLGAHTTIPDVKAVLPAPIDADFFALARQALRSHALRLGDLLTVFPTVAPSVSPPEVAGGSWVRVSAPGLGTLSLSVR
jgi:hypothetical protein